ncbi:hypothetical protein, partial [Mycolicibacterium sp.]|uniref:hypothetical protein n=1 Tax=Mycolicibacterium sp. TaxID=2320850 RepID=UPI0037CC67F2
QCAGVVDAERRRVVDGRWDAAGHATWAATNSFSLGAVSTFGGIVGWLGIGVIAAGLGVCSSGQHQLFDELRRGCRSGGRRCGPNAGVGCAA